MLSSPGFSILAFFFWHTLDSNFLAAHLHFPWKACVLLTICIILCTLHPLGCQWILASHHYVYDHFSSGVEVPFGFHWLFISEPSSVIASPTFSSGIRKILLSLNCFGIPMEHFHWVLQLHVIYTMQHGSFFTI